MAERAASVLSVTALTEMIRERLESDERLAGCFVAGEISNFKHHTSGHMYFTLKDDRSRIRAVMFASRNRALAFRPEDGMRVICRGSVGVFDRDGQYQLYVDDMQPDGLGALYAAFLQLRDRLAAEGLFAPERKRPLPAYPRRIGVVTSPTGAAVRDICSTLARRYPLATVVLAPALVQGPGAAASIVRALQQLAERGQVDVIIVGRGGGSIEELWPFNEEAVARAVAASPVPVVSAVWHETDVTICDFAADVRAATPTAAAELVAPHVDEVRTYVEGLAGRAIRAVRWRREDLSVRLARLAGAAPLQRPLRMVDLRRQHVDYLEGQLRQAASKPLRTAQRRVAAVSERLYRIDMAARLARARLLVESQYRSAHASVRERVGEAQARLDRAVVVLEALNPLTVLRRGYSVLYGDDGATVITSVRQLRPRQRVRIRLADGVAPARIEPIEPGAESGEEERNCESGAGGGPASRGEPSGCAGNGSSGAGEPGGERTRIEQSRLDL
ncbi:MAG: exodeoxyribonuclease VII large subunit [Alicyclobacillus sp.]|nr:exodeoxyribonuclease VII large subunit [Alicyclobacillus sp.]